MKYLLQILLVILCNQAISQDISGVWYGNYEKQLLIPHPTQLVVEMSISSDTLIKGASHLYYNHNKYEHYVIHGIYHQKDSTVYFKEDSVLAIRLGLMGSNCAGNYKMKLRITDSSYILEGKWRDNEKGFLNCPVSKVFLEKKFKKADSLKTNMLTTRANEIQSLIEYKLQEKDSIRIDVYDNGQIDNDIVSIYFNDSILVGNLRITDKAATFYISLRSDIKFNKIYMVSESMGEIPPCTALLVITTNKKRYEVNLSGNMSKNAAVEFFLKE
ncbi:MAG: hypothetical protein JST81_00765 [Bacteroidetes bacterium]|nr:hypothetical protein [Bacteroidota bacterium]